ncbi:MAG TPA: 2,3-diaminopropionate biosynthesis protein SbnA [Blastocatellia bacterium]|jgi:cysteine synthase A|nr:2,3-diaminopropionate biosynthesis protein SbnA [Blastocatellia bacterium]
MAMAKNAKIIGESVLSAIGNTPMVRLKRLFPFANLNLYAKLEMLNPGGSLKDRAAFNVIRQGVESGEIKPNSTIIESSSGNMGIGLAQACSLYGLRFICVVDPKTTEQNIRLLKTYGAEVDRITEPDPQTGEFLRARIKRVKHLLSTMADSFWPNQYANLYNSGAHYWTMDEIATELAGEVDYLFCSTSTCGTLRGCAEYIRSRDLRTKIVAVDALGSVIFGGSPAKRLIPGHGAGIQPPLYQPNLAQQVVHVTDLECVVNCRALARSEALLAGGSSGAIIAAVRKCITSIPSNANVVVILPDRGERYLDTIYSDWWVQENLGEFTQILEEVTNYLTN